MNIKSEALLHRSRYGALNNMCAMRRKLRVGQMVWVKEDPIRPGSNPEAIDGSKTRTKSRAYTIEKFYDHYILLQSVEGSYKRGMLYYDMLCYGRAA